VLPKCTSIKDPCSVKGTAMQGECKNDGLCFSDDQTKTKCICQDGNWGDICQSGKNRNWSAFCKSNNLISYFNPCKVTICVLFRPLNQTDPHTQNVEHYTCIKHSINNTFAYLISILIIENNVELYVSIERSVITINTISLLEGIFN